MCLALPCVLVFYYLENFFRSNYLQVIVRKKWYVERQFQLTVLLARDVLQFKVNRRRNTF